MIISEGIIPRRIYVELENIPYLVNDYDLDAAENTRSTYVFPIALNCVSLLVYSYLSLIGESLNLIL